MNPLLVSLAAGVLIGLLKVRSPAPPAIALLGLLGMLLGGALVHAVSPAQKPAIALHQPDVPPVSSLSRIS